MRARLTKDFTCEAAQVLPNAPEGHKCRRMHGHSFKIEVSVEDDVDPTSGWIYDHAEISAAMKPLLKILDHSYLNDIEGLENPTIEKMAAWFWIKLQPNAPGSARSSCMKRPLRAALIAASRRLASRWAVWLFLKFRQNDRVIWQMSITRDDITLAIAILGAVLGILNFVRMWWSDRLRLILITMC